MKTLEEIKERLSWHARDLENWREPDGLLIPTEPDPDERARIRGELQVAVLQWVTEPS